MSDLYYIPRDVLAKFLPDARSIRGFEAMMQQSKDKLPADINTLSTSLDNLSSQVDVLLGAPLADDPPSSDWWMVSALAPSAEYVDYEAAQKRVFGGYLNADQTVTAGVWTIVHIDTVEFDSHNEFDNATNYRYTPAQRGYYRVTAEISSAASTLPLSCVSAVYKNGSAYKYGTYMVTSSAPSSNVNCLVYLNGSTDYIDFRAAVDATSAKFYGTSTHTYLNIELIKIA